MALDPGFLLSLGVDIAEGDPPVRCRHGFRTEDRPLGVLLSKPRRIAVSSCCDTGITYLVNDGVMYCRCCLRTVEMEAETRNDRP